MILFILQNPWVGYLDRTYQQIKAIVFTKLGTKTPEITDHSDNNPLVDALDIWGGIAEVLHFYIDNKGRETFLSTARLFASAVKIARLFDYRVRGAVSASADLRFKINAPIGTNIVIPVNTEVQTNTGVKFFTVVQVQITAGQTEVTVAARNEAVVTGVGIGVSNGLPRQKMAINNTQVVDGSIECTVISTTWDARDTFGFSLKTDQHFVAGLNETGSMVVEFGDGVNGEIPANGGAVTVSYKTCDGAAGNVPENTITSLSSPVTVPGGTILTVTNLQRASSGVDGENLAALQRRVPLHLRTLQRAVTKQDYIDVANMINGVASAGLVYSCGKYVDIYIVPDGGGIASGVLIAAGQVYMDERKMITTNVVVHPAGEVHIKLVINIRCASNYANAGVTSAVLSKLTNFLSISNQQVGGSEEPAKVFLSDIYEQVEKTEGVLNSDISVMVSVPYARPLNGTTPVLNWVRSIKPTSGSTQKWKIQMITGSQYQLFKAGAFMGNYTVGQTYTDTDITLTINSGAYATNNGWEFYTYNYFGNISLVEPSVPVSLAGDITLNVSGGI